MTKPNSHEFVNVLKKHGDLRSVYLLFLKKILLHFSLARRHSAVSKKKGGRPGALKFTCVAHTQAALCFDKNTTFDKNAVWFSGFF